MNYHINFNKRKHAVPLSTFLPFMTMFVIGMFVVHGSVVSLLLYPFFGFMWQVFVAAGIGGFIGSLRVGK